MPYDQSDSQELLAVFLLLLTGYSQEEIAAFLDLPLTSVDAKIWEFFECLPSANEDFVRRTLDRLQDLNPGDAPWAI